MRILRYAAAVASASLLTHTVAAPTESVLPSPPKATNKSAVGTSATVQVENPDDPSKTKYFRKSRVTPKPSVNFKLTSSR